MATSAVAASATRIELADARTVGGRRAGPPLPSHASSRR